MKKPERKKKYDSISEAGDEGYDIGFNQCYDVWEKYHYYILQERLNYEAQRDRVILRLKRVIDNLPSEEEIQQIIDNQWEICHRCEGEGKLWADGLAHSPNWKGETISCGYCGGSGKINKGNLAKAISRRLGR